MNLNKAVLRKGLLVFLLTMIFMIPSAFAADPSNVSLLYDDIWTPPSGYTVSEMETVSVTSKKVENGTVSETADEAILTQRSNGEYIAVGVGEAKVTMTNTSTGETATITVKVKAAPLTIFFLTGQSNMEGSSAAHTGAHPNHSIVCPVGQVYSTYYPSDVERFKKISGIKDKITDYKKEIENKEKTYVAGSLSSAAPAKNVNGDELVYPLLSLTKEGNGKAGMDSGIAYTWNKETGDKVWTINTAVGASDIGTWLPDSGTNYKRASKVFAAAQKTAEAEEKAGHYVIKHRLMLWMQGEASLDWKDYGYNSPSVEKYTSRFVEMYNGFRKELKLEKIGMIVVRAHFGNDRDKGETEMNISRVAQYNMASSKDYPDIFMVSNANEQWVTDKGVKDYFAKAYPKGKLTYPLRSGVTLKLPTTIDDVHADIHFGQAGHNENGITAAKGMLAVLNGKTTPTSVKWRKQNGTYLTAVELTDSSSCSLYCELSPITAKGVFFKWNDAELSYKAATGKLKVLKKGSFKLTALSDSKKTLGEIKITYPVLSTPTLSSVSIKENGVEFKWKTVKNAAGYYVYRKNGSNGYKRIATVGAKTASYLDKTAANGVKYTYTVRAYNEDATSGFESGISGYYVKPNKVKSKKNKKGAKITVTVEKNDKATGYQVQFSTDSAFKKSVTTKTVSKNKSTTITSGNLKKKKTYYVRVRSYKKDGSKTYYSTWTNGGKITVKK